MNKRQAIMKMITDNPHLSVVELSKRTGLSRTVFYKWKAGNFDNIQIKSVQAVADATNTKITINGDKIDIIDDISLEGEENMNLESSYIIDLQKSRIESLEREVNQLRDNVYIMSDSMFESGMPTFESWHELKLFPFKMKNIEISDEYMILNDYLKCPEDIFKDCFRIDGKYYSWEDAPVNKILSQASQNSFKQTVKDFPIILRNIKQLIAKHYWEQVVTYEYKGNKISTHVRTKIQFDDNPISTYSKCLIINGDA